jgi:hypothetical protein
MPAKTFRHDGEEWEAIPHGIGVGVATGYVPRADRWGVTFRCLSDPRRAEVKGYVSDSDPTRLSDEELARALARALKRHKR